MSGAADAIADLEVLIDSLGSLADKVAATATRAPVVKLTHQEVAANNVALWALVAAVQAARNHVAERQVGDLS